MSDPIPVWNFAVRQPRVEPRTNPIEVDVHFDGQVSPNAIQSDYDYLAFPSPPNVIQYGRDFRTTKVERIGGPIFVELRDGVRFIPLCSQCDCPAQAVRWSGEPLKSRYQFVCEHCATGRNNLHAGRCETPII